MLGRWCTAPLTVSKVNLPTVFHIKNKIFGGLYEKVYCIISVFSNSTIFVCR